MTPLHYAAREGHQSVVECLLKCEEDVNAFDKVAIASLASLY